MLVARSFTYGSKSPPEKTTPIVKEKPVSSDNVRRFGWRPDSFLRANGGRSEPPSIRRSPSPEPARPTSQPVAVPRRRTTSSNSRNGSENRHDPDAMSPSVAALLAMTQIPKRRVFRHQQQTPRMAQSLPRRMSAAELRKYWREMDRIDSSSSRSFSSSPTMDVLLSPPDEDEDEDPLEHLDDDSSYRFGRSASNESMPSLDHDDRSIASWLSPSTPSVDGRRQKKSRAVSLSKTVDSGFDHPLMHDLELSETEEPAPPSTPSTPPEETEKQRPDRRQWRFRSNLTASITALRSAAKSLSNFTAPSIPPDDHLSRGLFGDPIPYRPELRPRPIEGTPTAELRRYMNPHAFQLHDFHLHNTHLDHTDLALVAATQPATDAQHLYAEGAVIPLEDYKPSKSASSNKQPTSTPPPAYSTTEAGRARTDAPPGQPPSQHRREMRENAEFLRVCVLEMQMLRAGKIHGPIGVRPGRRAFWLPPRQVAASSATSVVLETAGLDKCGCECVKEHKVPARWVAVNALDA